MYDVIVVGARVAGSPTAMLLARRGFKVLLLDKATFPSDTMSTHYIHQPGVASLKRWGLLDQVMDTGCPPMTRIRFDLGPIQLNGFGPAADGCDVAISVRRTVLDHILSQAAAEAGAELREGFSVDEVLMEDGRVTGVRGRDASGAVVTEHARVVVGADGRHSRVAQAVDAPKYNEKPALTCYYYSYWENLPMDGAGWFAAGEGSVMVGFPTNDGRTCVIVGRQRAEFENYRADIEGTFFRTLDELAPAFAERVRSATRAERWTGTADLPNFFHKPYGPGWALVGDAGYHKDPITGYGITDAFRDAETLATKLCEGLAGTKDMEAALAEYEQERNAFAMPLYEVMTQLATLELPPPDMLALFGALQGNQDATNRFFGVLDGTVSVPEFFDPANIGAIMAAAQAGTAA